jgi:hypothetical protein
MVTEGDAVFNAQVAAALARGRKIEKLASKKTPDLIRMRSQGSAEIGHHIT